MELKLLNKRIPFYVCLLLMTTGMAGSVSVYAVLNSATIRSITTISGEILVISEHLTATPQGVGITTSTASAVGSTLANNETMTAGGASANTALTQGYFEYRLKVEIATVAAGVEYSVELFADGTSKGKVYIGQASSGAAIGNYVTIKWNLGTSLASSVYEIQVLPAA